MNRRVGIGLAAAGFVLHLAIGAVPFAVTGLVAPPWAVTVVLAYWATLLVVAIRLARDERRRPYVIAVPVVALIGWFAFVSFGGAVLGWTA